MPSPKSSSQDPAAKTAAEVSTETAPQAQVSKGERTRQHIFEVAIELFGERGFEATTMRLIAERAGVSLGNSYHYFANKEHLVRAFYELTCTRHTEVCREAIRNQPNLRKRLLEIGRLRIEVLQPYHAVSGELFSSVANPHSPLNPFSAQSRPVREASIGFMAEVVNGSDVRLPSDIMAELPRLLWLYHMGLVLLWVHDTSPGQRRSGAVASSSVELIMSLLTLSNLPLLRRSRRRLLALIADVASVANADVDTN